MCCLQTLDMNMPQKPFSVCLRVLKLHWEKHFCHLNLYREALCSWSGGAASLLPQAILELSDSWAPTLLLFLLSLKHGFGSFLFLLRQVMDTYYKKTACFLSPTKRCGLFSVFHSDLLALRVFAPPLSMLKFLQRNDLMRTMNDLQTFMV